MNKSVSLLLVEDEPPILEILEVELTDAGFQVIAASNGSHAVAELDQNWSSYRAVITDIQLGSGPNGWDIARRARELVGDIPIIYISGSASHDWSTNGVPNSVMIKKPFVTAQIVTAVTTLLNKADTVDSNGVL